MTLHPSPQTIGSATENWLELDKAHIWHPYTQMQTAADPQLIVRGKGASLFDHQDNEYIDAISSWWVSIHGHSHPHIAHKVYEQMLQLEHVIFAGYTHPAAIELAQRLMKHLPSEQSHMFFSDNGSTAVEVGIKMAIQYFYNRGERRTKILAFDQAYHGDTFGAMAAGGASVFNAPFAEMLFEVTHLPVPVAGEEERVMELLQKELAGGDVCCFIFEPLVLGAGGMIMYSEEVLDRMIAACKEAGAICIADEVMTGFGRTGRFFASDYLTHQPDILCLSKGLTGGSLPMSLTTCSLRIYEAFLSNDAAKTFFHGHSFTGNPVGCAAALASLDLLENPDCWDKIEAVVESHKVFADDIRQHPAVGQVRQRGTILAMELVSGETTGYLNEVRVFLKKFFREKNVILRPLGNVLYIMPPYVIQTAQLQQVYDAIREALDEMPNVS